MTLRLILGDQLNSNHSWFKKKDNNVIYFMAEMKQETNYVKHHIQKIVGFFSAMRSFAESLQNSGHQIEYWKLDSQQNTHNLSENIKKLIATYNIKRFEYQLPDEYRLDQQLKKICSDIDTPSKSFDTEHFYTNRIELSEFFAGKKQIVMEYFYRNMRKKHDILMISEKHPIGGQWNFDKSNRNKWKGEPKIPEILEFNKEVSEVVEMIQNSNISFFGSIKKDAFPWPTTR